MMYDKKERDAYLAVSAPEDLKNRVMAAATEPERKRAFKKPYFALAVCFMLVIAVSAFFVTGRGSALEIYAQGQLISADPIVLSGAGGEVSRARTAAFNETTVELEIYCRQTADISVSSGYVVTENESRPSDKAAVSGRETVSWSVDGTEKNPVMTVTCEKQTYSVALQYDNQSCAWSVYEN